jgi:hypothetical protein
MPVRLLREGILTSERINTLSPSAEVFYRRLMSVVDDFGRYYSTPSVLRAACYPLRVDAVTDENIRSWLSECEAATDPEGVPLVAVYAVKGRGYLQLDAVNPPRAKKSKYPGPADWSPTSPEQILASERTHAYAHPETGRESNCKHPLADESNCEQVLTNVPYSSSYSSSDSSSITSSLRSEVVQPARGGPDARGSGEVPAGPGEAEEANDPEEPPDGPTPAEIRQVYEHYLRAMGLQAGEYRLTPARRVKIRTRLTEFTPDALCGAIDSCRASPFHMGDMPKTNGAVFNDLEKHILKSQEKVEDWLRRRNGKAARTV